MKLSAVTFATVAAAVAVDKRDPGDVIFNVSDFSASCVPHSSQCLYSFTVMQPGTMEQVGVDCRAMAIATTGSLLPDIEEGTCELSSRTFKIIRSTDGLALFVSQPVSPSSNQTAVHQINNNELQMVNTEIPTGVVQAYVGPKDFPLVTPDYS